MNGRRSHRRFAVASSAEAILRALRDVVLEWAGGDEIVAISRNAEIIGEHLTLEIFGKNNRLAYEVRVVESRPVVIDGNVRHRLRLEELPVAGNRVPPAGTAIGALGVLTKEIHGRLVNCSASGCLIESPVRLDIGTVVALRLFIDGREFSDDVQIVRCRSIAGAGSTYHLGARYLWSSLPDRGSLRLATHYLAVADSDDIQMN
jgi:hypothetical protein